MKSITVRMSDEMHRKLKLKTVSDVKTIQEYIMELIESDMNEPNKEKKK